MSLSDYAENALLAAICNHVPFSVTTVYVQLHLGDPGEACTANPAANTVRQIAAFAVPAGGTASTTGAVTWTNIPVNELYSYVSLWDAAAGGNAIWSGPLTAPIAVTAGNVFVLPAGSLSVSLN